MNLSRARRYFALGASALLHLLLVGLVHVSSKSPREYRAPIAKTMQIETMGEKDYLEKLKERYQKKEKQIVQMDDRLKTDLKPDQNQKTYLSKHNQVADQNMRAERVGKFKNVDREGIKSQASKVANYFKLPDDLIKAEDELRPQSPSPNAPSGRLFKPEPSRSPASLGPDGDGYSATDDYLKDVVIGSQTILNTEEYKFYAFYARIREALSSQWSFRVKHELSQIYASGASLQGNEKITKIEVRLSAKGELLQARILTSSGYHELDRAASEAFKAAAPFPHPPKDMVNQRNEVSIKWDFVVYASQGSGLRIQVQRGGM
jgi:TonB family protein